MGKWLYKEFEMEGVIRIGEMAPCSDDTPGASTKKIDSIVDDEGLECYRLIDGEPVLVGPRPRSAEEIDNFVNQKVNQLYSQAKRSELYEIMLASLSEGQSIPSEYKKYLDDKLKIRTDIEAAEAKKTYKGDL